MIDRSKVKLGEPLSRYRFKPGECIVNSDFANEFRQGICTQKELDDLKMLVVEVGIDRMTQNESYGLLYYSIAGGDGIVWNQIHQWRLKTTVESSFEPCDHPEI
jgi:hypothetical protein